MRPGDTIVAPATAPGRSWRAMVRISGPRTFPLLHALGHAAPPGRRLTTAILTLHGTALPVLLTTFPAPRSYTGEDTAEVQLPGNPTLVERLLHALTAHEGVRLAQPGEFTARAYLAGRLTLAQAEGVAATIAATTREQLDAAADLLEGRTGERYRAWAEELATLLALVEAGIDFTDQEDVVAISTPELSQRLGVLEAQLRQHLGGVAEATGTLPRVALVGRPNAGKSTLFNALLGRRRSITSPVAGTTRDVLTETLDLSREAPAAGSVEIQDLAGLESAGAHAADQVAAYRALAAADLLVWCDPSGRFDAAPMGLPAKPTLRVRTFGDQPGVQGSEDLVVCALDGWNLGVLRRAIADAATSSRAGSVAALLPRHRRAVRQAIALIRQASEVCCGHEALSEPEVVALTLRLALDQVGELAGQVPPDEVLGRVFATFCVGK